MSSETTGRDWTAMRAQDWDASLPLTLFDTPSPTTVQSTGDDLLTLLDD